MVIAAERVANENRIAARRVELAIGLDHEVVGVKRFATAQLKGLIEMIKRRRY